MSINPAINIAAQAAREASKLLLRYFDHVDRLKIEQKRANEFVTEVDRASEQIIIDHLKNSYPQHAILAEESGDHQGNDYLWIIDPLDGTTNYLHGFPQFAISIALQYRNELQIGVVYDPLKDELFSAAKGEGAYLNQRRIRVNDLKGLKGALLGTGLPYRDFNHEEAYFGMMKSLIRDTAGIRRPGSAALDFAWLAAGRLDGFWELGLSQWDFAAGALLVKEAGGMVTDLSGGPDYFQTGNVVAGHPKVHAEMLSRIRPFLNERLKK